MCSIERSHQRWNGCYLWCSLSKPAKGDYRPASAEILYTDAGMVGEVDIGQFDPYGGTGSGLLGAIALTNRTVSIKV